MYANEADNLETTLLGRMRLGLRKRFKGKPEPWRMVFEGGVRYRRSPVWGDVVEGLEPVRHGQVVLGALVPGEGGLHWLECTEERFLPTCTPDEPRVTVLAPHETEEPEDTLMTQLKGKLDQHIIEPVKASIREPQSPTSETAQDHQMIKARQDTMARRLELLQSEQWIAGEEEEESDEEAGPADAMPECRLSHNEWLESIEARLEARLTGIESGSASQLRVLSVGAGGCTPEAGSAIAALCREALQANRAWLDHGAGPAGQQQVDQGSWVGKAAAER